MVTKVFIDGASGTTGLEIRERLARRRALELGVLDDARRKDVSARADALNSADVVILCLPDAAAREAVSLITNSSVRVIDPSTAHRVAEGWVFGFPELEPKRRDELRVAKRVTNPGCYSTGFLAIVRPLV
jgi:N-acetyl-gamma-glutamyl-phosphate reductase